MFDHEKLDGYRVAREFLALAHDIVEAMPRGSANLADQLGRAASSVLLNTAEGAGRREGREKARFYDIARGSATECAAILDALEIRTLASKVTTTRGRALLIDEVKILAGLARSAIDADPRGMPCTSS